MDSSKPHLNSASLNRGAERAGADFPTIHRHALVTRIWHWLTALSVIVLLGSGLMILNAHGQLYWGEYGANYDKPWFALVWFFDDGRVPGWLTIPSNYNLALARRWHLSFALILAFALLAYMVFSLINRHFQHDLRIRARELRASHLIDDAKAHARLQFHDPANPRAYNIFQKLAYAGVIFVLLPLVIFTGLTMSPAMNAAWPWLLDLFGGRQSARSIHFIVSMLLAAFIVVHLALVILAGPINEVRSMLTGKWRVPR